MDKQTNRNPLRWFHPDVPKSVRGHLLGSNHTAAHKVAYGVAMMTLGVGIVKSSLYVDSFILHFLADGLGYLLHGIGAIPIIKLIDREGSL